MKRLGTTHKYGACQSASSCLSEGWPGITDDLQTHQAREQRGDNLKKNHPEVHPPSQECLGPTSTKRRPHNLETSSDTNRHGWQSVWEAGRIQSGQGLFGNVLTAAESRQLDTRNTATANRPYSFGTGNTGRINRQKKRGNSR